MYSRGLPVFVRVFFSAAVRTRRRRREGQRARGRTSRATDGRAVHTRETRAVVVRYALKRLREGRPIVLAARRLSLLANVTGRRGDVQDVATRADRAKFREGGREREWCGGDGIGVAREEHEDASFRGRRRSIHS